METTDGGCSKLLSVFRCCRELQGQLLGRAAGGRYAEMGVNRSTQLTFQCPRIHQQ